MIGLSYLGKAEKYPFTPDELGGFEMTSGFDLIKQSLLTLFSTCKGTITFRESFGCNAELLQYEPNDDILASLLIFFLSDAAFEFEKRVQITSITTVAGPDVIKCHVFYDILQANRSDSLVFPFQRQIKG